MAKRKRSRQELDKLCDDFRGRMAFLETMWGCRTEYEVDYATGRAWFKITPAGSSVTLSVYGVDVEEVLLPGAQQ